MLWHSRYYVPIIVELWICDASFSFSVEAISCLWWIPNVLSLSLLVICEASSPLTFLALLSRLRCHSSLLSFLFFFLLRIVKSAEETLFSRFCKSPFRLRYIRWSSLAFLPSHIYIIVIVQFVFIALLSLSYYSLASVFFFQLALKALSAYLLIILLISYCIHRTHSRIREVASISFSCLTDKTPKKEYLLEVSHLSFSIF